MENEWVETYMLSTSPSRWATSNSVAGHHILAILEMSKNYDELSTSLQDTAGEINNLSQLELDGEFYQLQYFLGGDWKFLALVCGLNAANSDYSCIWCKCIGSLEYGTKMVLNQYNQGY